MLMADQVILYIVRCFLFMDYRKIDTVWKFLCGVLGIPKCDASETYNWTLSKWHPYNEKNWIKDQELNIELVSGKLVNLNINRKGYVFTVVCKLWLSSIHRMNGTDMSAEQAENVDYCFKLLPLVPLPPEITDTAPQVVTNTHKEALHAILEQIGSILDLKFSIRGLDFTLHSQKISDTVETINRQIGLVTDGAAVELIKHFVLLLELVVTMSDADACEYTDLTAKITLCSKDLHDYRPAKVSTGQSQMWHALNRIAAVIERKLCN